MIQMVATESQHQSSAAFSGSRRCPEDCNCVIASVVDGE